ncbi:nucleotide sugar dehydrogenase [Actinomadura sp. LD22]|uniref:Nucleotide sugar dehydrogenase n=1 Tax=Actinomadura physcomitrii TaxID=2650748 RepID=A0A6I4MDV5_9ACTN|nr:nucleotide sugar dehydrogenase [Actinomadura physcomitrii]MWA00739.1 nucleotide sugar dehydrogenase [Actinomadura physcomitrii]
MSSAASPIGARHTDSSTYDVAVIGLGYVGLPTALAFHAAGLRVLGVDRDPGRLEAIRAGRVDLLDSDHQRLREARDGLTVTADPADAARADALIICVPTPVNRHLVPDLGALTEACATAAAHARDGQTIVLTSTSYVGSTRDLLVRPLAARGLRVGTDVFVAFSPERIDPGNDRHPHEEVPRVVGGVTPRCAVRAMALLGRYAGDLHRVSSAEAAEMTKLLENTFRAVNIALVNEFADASRLLELDVMEVIEAAATKPYGFMPFFPGPGAGGHCIPCDPHYLLWQLKRDRLHTPLVSAAMNAIAMRPGQVVERARQVLSDHGRGLAGADVLVLGVAYKPDVEDLRESPALEIIDGLLAAGAAVRYHDPRVPELVTEGGTKLASAEPGPADLVIAHTPHQGLDLDWLREDQLLLDATYRFSGPARRVAL